MGMIGMDDEGGDSGDTDEAVDSNESSESGNAGEVASAHLNCEPQGAWVTAERAEKIADVLEPDEQVHYLIRCNTIKVVEGHVPTDSNSKLLNGMRGFNRAAFTDRRVIVKVPTFLKTTEISLPYGSIEHVQYATGLLDDEISIRGVQNTYELTTLKPDEAEIEEAANFLHQQVNERVEEELAVTERDEDPYEELEKLKGLYDEDIITQAEFEAKKQKLMDKI